MTKTSNGTSYQYDTNSNMVLKTTLKGQYAYSYDAKNKLRTIGYKSNNKIGKTIARYYYDGDGGRTNKVVHALGQDSSMYLLGLDWYW